MDAPNSSITKQDELLRALRKGNVELFQTLLDDKEVRPDFYYDKKGTCLEIACRDKIPNCEEIITLLLKKVKPNVHSLKPEPIHFAVDKGNVTALKLLLSDKRTKINVVNSEGLTPLHFAARNFKNDVEKYSKILELLLACQDLDINKPNKNGCTAIYEAAHSGCKEAVLKMLELRPVGFNLDAPRSRGRSARDVILRNFPDIEPLLPLVKLSIQDTPEQQVHLLTELLNGRIGSFKRLLQQVDEEGTPIIDPNYNYVEPYPTTCLNEACKKRSLINFVRVLLEAGADPNLVTSTTRRAPIHIAIFFSNLEAVEVLFEQQPFNENIQDKSGNTPLHYIVNYIEEDEQAIQLIDKVLKMGADLKVRNKNNKTAFMDAVTKKRNDVVTARVDGMQVKDEGKPTKFRLFHCLYGIDSATFLKMLDENNSMTLLDSSDNRNTLLQTACLANMKDAVEKLLKKGADPNLTTTHNLAPPLIISASNKQNDILETFLEYGSHLDVNKADKKGNTALHIIARSQNFDMVVKLLQAGADIGAKNNLGKEPISCSVLKVLLDSCLKTDTETYPGDEKYTVKFNFEFLVARKTKKEIRQNATFNRSDEESASIRQYFERISPDPELNTLSYIINTHSEISIIKHPIITSFVTIKWSRLKYISFVNLFFTLLFTIILNLYIYWGCYIETRCTFMNITILNLLIGVLLLLVTLRELAQILSSPKTYIQDVGNLLDLSMISFTVLTVFIPLRDVDAKMIFTVLTVLSSTTSLMMVSGRLRLTSQYIAIFKKVTKNFMYMLILYSMVLFSFSICFYVLFRDTENQDFPNFFHALFKVIMMMSGDLSADSIKYDYTSVICYLTFTAFGLIVVIVLLNLLTGLAVSDIQEIKQAASLLSIRSQIKTMTEIELAVLRFYRWAPILSRLYSIDNFMVGAKININSCVYPNRSCDLIVDENESVKMNQECLSYTMKIIGERSAANKKLSVNEQLLKIQESLQQIISKVDATASKTITDNKNE